MTDITSSKSIVFNDTPFNHLMRNRIYRVLMIASSYDAFLLEEDGRIDEQIFNEYVSLNLRYPPTFFRASSFEEAEEILKVEKIDAIIEMLNPEDSFSNLSAKRIKTLYPYIPVVVLTPFVRENSFDLMNVDSSVVDYVFAWLGDASIILAIIKLIEDKMNADYDILNVGVQCVILVEDSVRFYSSILPKLYQIIIQQSESFMSEALNEHQKMLRKRGRPKIFLAKSYEDAVSLYQKYRNNLLGIISDVSYPFDGVVYDKAGIKLCDLVKRDDKNTSFMLMSTDSDNSLYANMLEAGFINKNSNSFLRELTDFIKRYLAFGDFVFIDPKTKHEVARVSNLRDLQKKIFDIPDTSFRYHTERNHISKWLRARALFTLADVFRKFTPEDFVDMIAVKTFVCEVISRFRAHVSHGVIAEFDSKKYDDYYTFTRIGQGSLGGKGRGLAFLDQLIKKKGLGDKYEKVRISIPHTIVLCTDVFDEFMRSNSLYEKAFSDNLTDEQILRCFLEAELPYGIKEDLRTIVSVISKPLAVRSSSLLEDSCYQPFAGVYSTFMIPLADGDVMVEMLQKAVKSVYASVYYHESKSYMSATQNLIDEEKMAVIIQEVCGNSYGDHFYPTISGVGRSINFYPVEPEQVDDGVVNLALGLGKQIVDGGRSLRFSPRYPQKCIQLSKPELTIRDSQNMFYALDMKASDFTASTDDAVNIKHYDLLQAEEDGTLQMVCSTFDFQDERIYDGYRPRGIKLVTFAYYLKYGQYQLVEAIDDVLKIGQAAMMRPVEVEFAVNFDPDNKNVADFYLLQIRPISNAFSRKDVDFENIKDEDLILRSDNTLGNGIVTDVYDVIYVKPQSFDASKTEVMAKTISMLNSKLAAEKRSCLLIGPGRWGSSEPWLGIPVKWSDISSVAVFAESALPDFRIDPSQGSHFFQNMTALGVGSFSLSPFLGDGFYDVTFLDAQIAEYEDDYIRHIRFELPCDIVMDGKKRKGIVKKPGIVTSYDLDV